MTGQETGGIGLTATGCGRVAYGSVTLHNTARTHPTHRALNLDSNATVYGAQVSIADTNNPPTGYVVGAHGSQPGSVGVIVDQVDNGGIVFDDPSGLAHF